MRKERKIVNEARELGLIAFRSAGSHSPIDVCIIDIRNAIISFIQCKPKNFSKTKKNKLEALYNELNKVFMVEFKVV